MALVGTVWTPVGPSPIQGGRQDNGLVSAIAIHPNDANIVLIGTAGGGVWRSRDAGQHWTPLFDRQLALGIGEPGALAFDPGDADTVYIGTSSRVSRQAAAGLYKSTDGGSSCIRLGSGYPANNTGNASQFFSQSINVIIVDPANGRNVYAATSTGVFRSTDGGQNWRRGTNSVGDALSLVLDATSPAGARVLYAGITGRGVFRSADSGQNWTQILSTATPAVAGALAGGGIGKVVVDLAPPTSPPNAAGIQVLYASMAGTGPAPDPVGLFQSVDAGTNWTQRTATGLPTRTQGGYSFHFAVDPGSAGDGATDRIFFGAVGQAFSTDAGTTFTAISGLHADTHSWAFSRRPAPATSIAYCGNDGGVFRSTDGGTTWTALNTGSLQTGLIYNLASRPDATASVMLAALQDNGLLTTSGAAAPAWSNPQGGDGWDIAYDGGTAGRVYGTSGFWSPNPCTRLFVSGSDGSDFNTAQDITPWGTTSDQGCYLAPVTSDPSATGIVYVGGNQNLWQTRNGGTNWRIIGTLGGVATPAVAPTNSNNVAAAVGNQVWVTTNALATTVGAPNGVVFTNITRNLPNRNVLRVAFDPNDPAVLFAVLGGFNGFGPGQQGHVFRTTIAGTAWTDISPPLDVPFGAIALDGTDNPSTLYVGTDFGVLRSVDRGASWTVLDDIRFPRAPVTDLVLSQPAGVLRAATYGRGVYQFTNPTGPAITIDPENNLDFGTVCATGSGSLSLRIFNVGKADLVITSVQRLMGAATITVLPFPGTPVVVEPGEDISFSLRFTPTTASTVEIATIRIVSNDPLAPIVDLAAQGVGGKSDLQVVIPDHGDFGEVCLGEFVDRDVFVANSGSCPLRLFQVTSSSPVFEVPQLVNFPISVASGAAVTIPLRFRPSARGPASATITFVSDDPTSPATIRVSGLCPPPRLVTAIPDAGDFGDVCVHKFRDEELVLSNSGHCPLTVRSISSSSADFVPPSVTLFPIVVDAGDTIDLPIRFAPTTYGPKAATLTVVSDDPASPATVQLRGNAPPPELRVTGTTYFGPVEMGTRARETLSICNVGPCDLHVTRVAFLPQPCCPDCDGCGEPKRHGHEHDDQRCTDFCLVNNPFPATVKPGSCLGVTIQYTPSCDGARCCELVIDSDDPVVPRKLLTVTGHLRRTLSSAVKCWVGFELREMLNAGQRRC